MKLANDGLAKLTMKREKYNKMTAQTNPSEDNDLKNNWERPLGK